ncbi:MAG: ABC transporter substrate-binding protein [Acidobacteriota bacterium]
MLSRLAGGTALAASIGCSSRKPSSSGPTKIKVLGGRSVSMSTLFLTLESGYFKDADLDVEIDQLNSANAAIAPVISGKADVIFTSLGVPFLAAMGKGLPLKIVAGRERASTTCGNIGVIIGLKKKFPNGLDNAAVLKGKTVGVGPMIGFPQFSLDTHLASAGLSVEDIIPRTMRSPDAIAAMVSGSLDAANVNFDFEKGLAPVMSEIVRSPGLAHYYPNLQISHTFFGPSLLRADPDVGARFLKAFLRGVRDFAAGGTPEYMKKLARESAVDPRDVTGMCRDSATPNCEIDMKSVKILSDWAFKRKYLSAPLDPAALVDARFIERAHAT